MGVRKCACGCGEALPKDARPNAKYVDAKHRRRMEARRYRRRKRDKSKPLYNHAKPVEDQSFEYKDREQSKDGRATARRGRGYEYLVAHHADAVADMHAGRISQSEMAERLEPDWPADMPALSQANLSRWGAAYAEDQAKGLAQERWSRDGTVEECLQDFAAFCRRYWPDDQVTEFHMEWADLISEAIDEGGRVMLLAAQRHGKSHLLRKYCAWRIAQNPDIRILWVSQSQDLAEKAVGYVLDILTGHEQLKQEILGPGEEFRPPTRQNMSWTSQQFTVGCRTKVQASPTMVALGKGGSILSRDADVIIVDDLQEHKHIRSPNQRETDNEWFFTDLMSRKLPKTGLAVIGSRQHLQDIYSEILKKSEQWTVKVYPVHDPACLIDEDDHEAHDESGCMLWPEQYPHEYMQEQRAQQGEAYFQRNMMNNPKDEATILVSAKDLERCKDPSRVVGQFPKGVQRVVCGIDPATAKPVAGALFAWDGERRHLIDIIEAEPGVRGVRQIIAEWSKLTCRDFILEKNMGTWAWDDRDVQDLLSRTGARLIEHGTYHNKNDISGGVVAMFHKMRTDPPVITFPYGDRESQKKMDRLFRALLNYDPDYTGNKHQDDDLPMAMWFTMPEMDRWTQAYSTVAEVDYPRTPYVPWRTAYPTRHLEVVA